jgi:hypothetical protein
MNDKIIVTNLGALKKKYGANGLAKIRAAVKALISADKARGFPTRLLALDSASAMKKVKAAAVTDPASARQNKAAIDAVFVSVRPDYLMILGAIDVVPHQDLNNPVYSPNDDPDEYAFGDLPYACETPYSQQPEKFIGPTRVVGRLPDLTAGTDPTYLVGLLETAAKWNSLTRADYSDYFAVSTETWKGSTSLSVQKLFGSSKKLNLCPPKGPKWSNALLDNRAHFINCHGAPADPLFYGEPGDSAIAHDAEWVAGKIAPGAVAAIECCYGAELYDPNLLPNRQPGMCNTYLEAKAYGYLGSSTIAYGPEDGNGAADLLCQYFLRRVLAGASLGRALLEARQEFAQAGPDLDPFDIKTLAQFSLFGDPSIHPVVLPTPQTPTRAEVPKTLRIPKGSKNILATAAPAAGLKRGLFSNLDMLLSAAAPMARAERRKQLLRKGLIIGATEPVARRATRTAVAKSILTQLQGLAREANIGEHAILSFNIGLSATPQSALAKKVLGGAVAKLPSPDAYHVVIDSRQSGKIPIPQITAVVAKEFDGKLVSYRKLVSR